MTKNNAMGTALFLLVLGSAFLTFSATTEVQCPGITSNVPPTYICEPGERIVWDDALKLTKCSTCPHDEFQPCRNIIGQGCTKKTLCDGPGMYIKELGSDKSDAVCGCEPNYRMNANNYCISILSELTEEIENPPQTTELPLPSPHDHWPQWYWWVIGVLIIIILTLIGVLLGLYCRKSKRCYLPIPSRDQTPNAQGGDELQCVDIHRTEGSDGVANGFIPSGTVSNRHVQITNSETPQGRITGNGQITSNGQITGNGQITASGQIIGNGQISGNGQITANRQIAGNGQITGNGQISNDLIPNGHCADKRGNQGRHGGRDNIPVEHENDLETDALVDEQPQHAVTPSNSPNALVIPNWAVTNGNNVSLAPVHVHHHPDGGPGPPTAQHPGFLSGSGQNIAENQQDPSANPNNQILNNAHSEPAS